MNYLPRGEEYRSKSPLNISDQLPAQAEHTKLSPCLLFWMILMAVVILQVYIIVSLLIQDAVA
jgi:hypothetical protein